MAVELRAFSDALCDMGNRLAGHGESLLALQRSCQDAAEGAQSGWVGSSAGALTGLLDRWATASAAHVGRFGEHSCGMHFAAAGLTEMEQTNAASLR
ncbi:hypothetical protein [Mycobacterium angelicum]|uniref:WXG100 family type VII secretion target n=1 Tax=Mycobacterium angelicum TaxID=470074 RepID=A0A1X0A0D3_MYCAN|nr:hypothetical protein [Mycobacterium angelicum]MCV7196382.1 hypothetical protein [Mycobacterium angelicum]ORA23345.1 hypothetical protein BST12_07740 [Mycobacterium angelicum]